MNKEKNLDGEKWGLNVVAGEELGERLEAFCGSYAGQMRTKTRDTSQ